MDGATFLALGMAFAALVAARVFYVDLMAERRRNRVLLARESQLVREIHHLEARVESLLDDLDAVVAPPRPQTNAEIIQFRKTD